MFVDGVLTYEGEAIGLVVVPKVQSGRHLHPFPGAQPEQHQRWPVRGRSP
jgi:hypothetical protein